METEKQEIGGRDGGRIIYCQKMEIRVRKEGRRVRQINRTGMGAQEQRLEESGWAMAQDRGEARGRERPETQVG